MNQLIVKAPLNDTSFGNVSVNILRELYKKKINITLFPVGNNIDLSVYDKLDDGFQSWISRSYESRFKSIDRKIPTFQLWHLNGSESKLSDKSFLYTYYELDSPTFTEIKLANLHEKVFLSSSFARDCFRSAGCKNAEYVPTGFDPDICTTNKKYLADKIHFGLMGKFEKRKHTGKILKLWAERFGNDHKYQLSCAIVNRFYPLEQMNQNIGSALDGKYYGNINFLPFLATNSEVTDLMNAIDIDLTGLSGAEGWNLPSFNSSCLGKWSCVLNSRSHKDWANELNCIPVEPNGKEPAYDDLFFKEGSDFNQGSIDTFDNNGFHSAIDRSLELAKTNNAEGEKLKSKFSYENCVNKILEHIF
jgi:hypothetical protein